MKKLLLLFLIVFIGRVKGQVCFNPATNYTVGYSGQSAAWPFTVVSSDFNNDGYADLAVSVPKSHNIVVLFGDGNGNFPIVDTFKVGLAGPNSGPTSLCSADFNNDGKKDLATVNETDKTISILFGNGTGNFATTSTFTVGYRFLGTMISADFNSDGKADLATSDFNGSNAAILLNTGTGSFSSPILFPVGFNPCSITAGDFNGDTKIDIATANWDGGNISVLLGNRLGSFGAAVNIPTGPYPSCVKSADFNSDGFLDLAATNYGSNDVSILLGDGAGNFAAPLNFTVGISPYGIQDNDFNGDGKIDLAITNYHSGNISVLLGTGTGAFGIATNFSVGVGPFSIVSADFNGDASYDLAVTNMGSITISVLLNCLSSGVDNFNNTKTISVYPNPTSDQFFIDANTNDNLIVDLYDVDGRQVLNTNINDKSSINVANLNEGVYALAIRTQDRLINKKLVIVR